MRNSRQQRFICRLRAPLFAVMLMTFATACGPIGVLNLVSKSALFLTEDDTDACQSSEPISIEAMLAQVRTGNESAEFGDALPIRITFSLPPDAIDLSVGQRADLEDKLRDIDAGTAYSVVISSGPGGLSGDASDAFIAAQRVRSAASHFSAMTAKPRLRYDPTLAPGELRIIIEPTKKNGNA